MTEIINYTSEKEWLDRRLKDVTSTEVSALFGMSPYASEFELWQVKKNPQVAPEFNVTERMNWGNALEEAIAKQISADMGFEVSPLKVYMRDPEIRMGSSFDFSIDSHPDHEGKGLLEIKNVDSYIFSKGWKVEGDVALEAPPHIELQCQQQLAVSGRDYLYLGVLVGGNRSYLIKRTPIAGIIEKIRNKITEFWISIENNVQPMIDFERDATFINSLYQYGDKDYITYSDESIEYLAGEYKRYSDMEKEASKKKQGVKAELLTLIGESGKVIGSNFTISSGTVAPKDISYTREGYRSFRINWKRSKL